MKYENGKAKWDLMLARMFSVSLFIIFHLSFFISTVEAQAPVRHSCWDITIGAEPEEAPRPQYYGWLINQPHIVSESDSGIMIIAMAKEYLGTPYRYGGKTPKGFDCAGFARFLYLHFGHELPPYSGGQGRVGTEVSDTRNLLPGDLVLFGGRHHSKAIGHTGLVISTDTNTGVFTFIHSATHGGVIISRSTEPYYKARYITARRIFVKEKGEDKKEK